MHFVERKFLTALKHLVPHSGPYEGVANDFVDAEIRGQAASDLIKGRVVKGEPLMIGRFGATELAFFTTYLSNNEKSWWLRRRLYYIQNKIASFGWNSRIIDDMVNVSGFFPFTETNARLYAHLVLQDVEQLDILGSWLYRERLISPELQHVTGVQLPDLEPYSHQNPWTEVLAGKKVLVVHPFADTIQKQYKVRKQLFVDQRTLPDFELETLKAVQSAGQSDTPFANWFEALDHMKVKMDERDYDIAIIGCGAYGFHLAAHAKRRHKIGVHLGGATQMLFGIKGKRWENNPGTRELINAYWVKPSEDERPEKYTLIENGCYW
ncbi:hypothetical protein LC612_39395 [Nostoc sp. CHAB 5834]|nr:hypothetical protein [Nostoc sp. CHAB 5834]